MRGQRALPVLLVALLLAASAGPAAGWSPASDLGTDLAPSLQSIIDSARDEYPIVGLSAAVVLPDGSRWESGSGLLELGSAAKLMLADTSSVAGSITKTFVTALILQLVEEGRLELGDRLSRWYPEYPFASSVTVRHLLRHTSGLKDYFLHPDYARLVFKRPLHHWTPTEILGLVRDKLLFAPGSGWSYSNTNFLFLGLIAESVTGNSLASELRTRFLTSLGLSATFFQGQEAVPVEAAHGYLWNGSAFRGLADGTAYRPHTSAATVAWAAGGMLSSAHDIATWTRALYSGQLLGPALMTKMVTFNESEYGMGTRRFYVDGSPAWGHTGSLRGYTAVTMYLPEQELTVVVMTNRGRISAVRIARQLAHAAIASLASAEKAA